MLIYVGFLGIPRGMTVSFRERWLQIRVIGAMSVVTVLGACAIVPKPLTQTEFESRAAADRQAMFADQPPLAGPLTLPDALARVLRYNLDRRARMMEEALALGQLDLDRFDLLPELTANAGYAGRDAFNATRSKDLVTQVASDANPTYSTDRDLLTADLGLTWNILDFGVSWYTAHQNADRALIAAERRRKAVANLAQEVRHAFWRAAATQALRERVIAVIAEAERALSDMARVEAERLREPTEVLRMQKTLLENIRQLEGIDQRMVSAKAELAALINLPPGTDFQIAASDPADMRVPDVPMPIEELERAALANNPDLREQVYRSRIATEETRKELLKLLPGISFDFSRQYDSNSFLHDNHWNQWGAKITWNLLNLLSAPDRIAHAETAEQVAEARRLALRMAVLAQVHVVSHQLASAGRQFDRADRLWRIETRLAEASGLRQQGGATNDVERITTETSAIAAELRRYQTFAQVQMAYGKLLATVGVDPLPDRTSGRDLPDLARAIGSRLASLEHGEAWSPPEADADPATVPDTVSDALSGPPPSPRQPDGGPLVVDTVAATDASPR